MSYRCNICRHRVEREQDLREHLAGHHPTAWSMPWEAVRNTFTLSDETNVNQAEIPHNVEVGDTVYRRHIRSRQSNSETDISVHIEKLGEVTEIGVPNAHGYLFDFKIGDTQLSPFDHELAIVPPREQWPEPIVQFIERQNEALRPHLVPARLATNSRDEHVYRIIDLPSLDEYRIRSETVEFATVRFGDTTGWDNGRFELADSHTTYGIGDIELTMPHRDFEPRF